MHTHGLSDASDQVSDIKSVCGRDASDKKASMHPKLPNEAHSCMDKMTAVYANILSDSYWSGLGLGFKLSNSANSLILLHKRPDQACWASLQNPSQNLLIKCSQPRISRALTPQVCVLSTVFREASWRPLKDYLLLESSISIPPGSRPKPEDRERCLVE